MTDTLPNPASPDENRLIAERRGKLAKLREDGCAFPNDFVPSARGAALHAQYGKQAQEALAEQAVPASIGEPRTLKRVMRKASFATAEDATARTQAHLEGIP